MPFGPARNGAIVFAGSDQDIHALDPVTGHHDVIDQRSGERPGSVDLAGRHEVVFLRETTIIDTVLGGQSR